MPTYRVKSGTINLTKIVDGKRTGQRYKVVANDVVDLTIETATKFKDLLQPMSSDATFLDNYDEYSDMINRETHLKIVPINDQPGFFNVLNAATQSYINTAPLTNNQAIELIKGANLDVVFNEVVKTEIDEIEIKKEEETSKIENKEKEEEGNNNNDDNNNNNNNNDDEEEVTAEYIKNLKKSELKDFMKENKIKIKGSKDMKKKDLQKKVIKKLNL